MCWLEACWLLTFVTHRFPHSVVMFGRNRFTFEPLAVKEVEYVGNGPSDAVENEHNALTHLPSHRNIVNYKGCFRSKRKASLVFEYVPFPSISKFLRQNGPLSTKEALFVVRQMVRVPPSPNWVTSCPPRVSSSPLPMPPLHCITMYTPCLCL